MSTVTLPPPAPTHGTGRLLTIADVAALPSRLPSGPVKYELHSGRLVVMSLPGDGHGERQGLFLSYLFMQGQLRGYGRVRGEVGLILRRHPDHLVGPDVAFLTTAQLPPNTSPEGYLTTIPELVVEVRSKNDTLPEIDQKVSDYLAAGVVLVWVAAPDTRTVTVCQSGRQPVVLTAADTLTALPVIPGFAVPVADLLPA